MMTVLWSAIPSTIFSFFIKPCLLVKARFRICCNVRGCVVCINVCGGMWNCVVVYVQ